jgi:Big-like domain-containing protein
MMHRYPLLAAACVMAFGLASGALAVTTADLECQSVIGDAGRAFAAARLKILVACNNRVVAGGTCDATRRDRLTASASHALIRRIVGACSGAALADLGFPGSCPDANAGSFSVDDLWLCIENAHVNGADAASVIQYPQIQTLLRDERRCQRGLGRAASAFIAENMRLRGRCLDAQLRGAIPETVHCRAEVQPYGPGTGDTRLDGALMQATARLFSRLSDACVGANVAALGFPGPCPAPLGDLDLGDVQHCVRATHQQLCNQMLDNEYPPSPTPGPSPSSTMTPSPTPTPLPVSLQISPNSATRMIGSGQNFVVAGYYADGSARNLTQKVEYFSSDESVAVAPNAPGNRSRVNAVGIGTALITATEPVTGLTTSNAATFTVILCAHDMCVAGTALDSTCDPCVTAICAADPACCTGSWSQACVAAVSSTCSASCPAG